MLDLSSVVIVVCGDTQGAPLGNNPRKRGRRSYHRLFGFEFSLHEFWSGRTRLGKAGAGTGVLSFLQASLTKVPTWNCP
jgi:hypothetical protein